MFPITAHIQVHRLKVLVTVKDENSGDFLNIVRSYLYFWYHSHSIILEYLRFSVMWSDLD